MKNLNFYNEGYFAGVRYSPGKWTQGIRKSVDESSRWKSKEPDPKACKAIGKYHVQYVMFLVEFLSSMTTTFVIFKYAH